MSKPDLSKATPRPWRYGHGSSLSTGKDYVCASRDDGLHIEAPSKAKLSRAIAAVNDYTPGLKEKARELAELAIFFEPTFKEMVGPFIQLSTKAREVLKLMNDNDENR